MTELNNIIQILYSNLSSIYCPSCDNKIKTYTSVSLVKELLEEHQGEKIKILSPLKSYTRKHFYF